MASTLDKIAKQANAALKAAKVVDTATLTKRTAGTRTPGDLAAGTQPTSASYAAKGVVESYTGRQVDGTLIRAGDRRIILLGESIESGAVPAPGDTVAIQGATYTLINVDRDAAAAAYICQGRGA